MFHWGGKRKKKNVTDTINTFKLWELLTSPSRLNTGGYHYIRFILSTGNGKSVQHVISVEGKLFRLQFSWTKRRQLGTLKVPLRRFFVKNIPKRVLCYHLPCSLQIFIKDWACFSVRGKNPKKKNVWLPPIFVDLSCPFKDLNFFRMDVLMWHKKPVYLACLVGFFFHIWPFSPRSGLKLRSG